ncbi:MAG: dihydroflavonol-4-reductase [Alphaproteobacteria bacterium]|jgi:dihydroflavonol-4-reductase|nr:dihydroflavonol-4-reductase [Alphaproteobacteria bacterium]
MSSAAKVLVTGATGFIGSAVAKALCEAGFAVRATAVPTSPRHHLAGLDLDFYEGDLRDPSSARTAMVDIQYVFHLAADYRLWARKSSEILKNNVLITRNVMEAALRARAERIVYTSSVATLALDPHVGGAADETKPLSEEQGIGAYKRSKIAAERLVEQLVANEGLPAVIVNPSTPVGPRDVRPTPTGRIIVEAAKGRIPAFVDTGLNLVHVDDVAAGQLAALHRGRIGERYILGGENVPFAQMLEDISRLVGRRAPRLRIPHAVALPIAYAAEGLALLTRKEPFASIDAVRMAKHCMYFTSRKAERELGFKARPYIEGLADAIRWFRGAGYLG